MKYICSSCGAEIDDNLPKCPYCDTMIPKGAEAEYMEKLYDIQEDMEELKEVPFETLKEEARHQGKRMGKIVVITLVIAAIFAVIFFWQEKRYERDNTEDYIWGQKNFPIMSELYENGDYEQLMELYEKALMEERPVWNWEYDEAFMEWMEEQE